MKPISDRRKEANKEYAKLKRAWRKDPANQVCHFPGCTRRAEPNPHHVFGRSFLLNVVKHWRAVCFLHHRFIHDNPNEARAAGLLAQKGQWLNPPKDL
jgi:hypothetical protein